MANYERVRGVGYNRWDGESDQPVVEQDNAKVEEMYVDRTAGTLVVIMATEEGHMSLGIPIKASVKWNEFADSLPRWELD